MSQVPVVVSVEKHKVVLVNRLEQKIEIVFILKAFQFKLRTS